MRKLAVAALLLTACSAEPTRSDERDSSAQNQPRAAAVAPGATGLGLSSSTAGLVQKTTAKGVAVRLDDRFHHAAVVRRGADGRLTSECHDDEQAAEAFMQGAAAGAAATAKGEVK